MVERCLYVPLRQRQLFRWATLLGTTFLQQAGPQLDSYASLTTGALSPGKHTITVFYGGDSRFDRSTAALSSQFEVSKVSTTTTLQIVNDSGMQLGSSIWDQSVKALVTIEASTSLKVTSGTIDIVDTVGGVATVIKTVAVTPNYWVKGGGAQTTVSNPRAGRSALFEGGLFGGGKPRRVQYGRMVDHSNQSAAVLCPDGGNEPRVRSDHGDLRTVGDVHCDVVGSHLRSRGGDGDRHVQGHRHAGCDRHGPPRTGDVDHGRTADRALHGERLLRGRRQLPAAEREPRRHGGAGGHHDDARRADPQRLRPGCDALRARRGGVAGWRHADGEGDDPGRDEERRSRHGDAVRGGVLLHDRPLRGALGRKPPSDGDLFGSPRRLLGLDLRGPALWPSPSRCRR